MPDRNYRSGNQQYPYGQNTGEPGMQGAYGTQAPQGGQGVSGAQSGKPYHQQGGYNSTNQGRVDAHADCSRVGRRHGGVGANEGTSMNGAANTNGAVGGSGTAGGVAAAVVKKADRKKVAIIAGVCVIVVALIIALVALLMPKDDFYDGNSIIGQAPYKTTEEIQAELDRKVEEGMLNISIASVIEFEDGQSEGTAYIENVPGNRYVMKVDITLDDTGEKVYESGGLKPGNYIEKIKLSKDLDAGSYSATATFHALDPETLNEVGSAAAIVTLNVLS